MKPTDLLRLLDEFFRERAALRDRHIAVARAVGHYDFNNTYQYIIAREDQHLGWVGDAIRVIDGTLPAPPAPPSLAAAKGEEAQRGLMDQDARELEEFAARWRPRVASVSNARVRLMLQLILGEVLEQARLLRQGADGKVDLLGRRTGGERTAGRVLPTRWVE